jgi:biotin carboxyl carrier protein
MHFKAKVHDTSYDIELNHPNFTINKRNGEWDVINTRKNLFHIIRNNKSYNAEVVSVNKEDKTVTVKINNNQYVVELKDRYDELLHELGMDSVASTKMNDLKAPMPGMVLKVLVKEGDEVKKGDSLLVLEAMKMENLLKAQGNGKVKAIKIKPGDKVEKNWLLMGFE